MTFAAMSGCYSSSPELIPQVIKSHGVAEDFMIPKEFAKIIESDLLVDTKILTAVYTFLPLQVLFIEKTQKSLKSKAVEYHFPKGGGRVDLSALVAKPGSFYMSFPPTQFVDLPELEHLFYVSQAPKKNISNEEFGLGCGKWIDIKSKFSDLQKRDFLLLNSSNLRHFYVTVGSYVFVFRKLNHFYITQLTVTDSKNSNELCPVVKGSL